MNEHTPGQWKAQRDLYNTPYPEKGFGIYSEVTHLRVADLCPASPVEGHDMETQEPNARLIATAPELLVALQKDIKLIEQLCDMVNTYSVRLGLGRKVHTEDFTETAREAIAKAQS